MEKRKNRQKIIRTEREKELVKVRRLEKTSKESFRLQLKYRNYKREEKMLKKVYEKLD